MLYGLFPFIVYLFIKNKLSVEIKNILPFIFVVFLAGAYEFTFTFIFKWNVSYWFIIYSLLAFFTITYFFYKLIGKQHWFLFLLSVIFFFILFFSVILRWNYHHFIELSAFIDAYQTVLVLFFSILWFRKIFLETKIVSLEKHPLFYATSALILYYCGSVTLFLLSSLILKKYNSSFHDYWILNIILNIVLKTLLIVTVWKARLK
jgi:hypothetical protein